MSKKILPLLMTCLSFGMGNVTAMKLSHQDIQQVPELLNHVVNNTNIDNGVIYKLINIIVELSSHKINQYKYNRDFINSFKKKIIEHTNSIRLSENDNHSVAQYRANETCDFFLNILQTIPDGNKFIQFMISTFEEAKTLKDPSKSKAIYHALCLTILQVNAHFYPAYNMETYHSSTEEHKQIIQNFISNEELYKGYFVSLIKNLGDSFHTIFIRDLLFYNNEKAEQFESPFNLSKNKNLHPRSFEMGSYSLAMGQNLYKKRKGEGCVFSSTQNMQNDQYNYKQNHIPGFTKGKEGGLCRKDLEALEQYNVPNSASSIASSTNSQITEGYTTAHHCEIKHFNPIFVAREDSLLTKNDLDEFLSAVYQIKEIWHPSLNPIKNHRINWFDVFCEKIALSVKNEDIPFINCFDNTKNSKIELLFERLENFFSMNHVKTLAFPPDIVNYLGDLESHKMFIEPYNSRDRSTSREAYDVSIDASLEVFKTMILHDATVAATKHEDYLKCLNLLTIAAHFGAAPTLDKNLKERLCKALLVGIPKIYKQRKVIIDQNNSYMKGSDYVRSMAKELALFFLHLLVIREPAFYEENYLENNFHITELLQEGSSKKADLRKERINYKHQESLSLTPSEREGIMVKADEKKKKAMRKWLLDAERLKKQDRIDEEESAEQKENLAMVKAILKEQAMEQKNEWFVDKVIRNVRESCIIY